ncbi:unnamed protein product [Closterium sp. NIES-54]
MENLMYKDWKAENEAKIGMRMGDVKSSGLEHVELPLELSSGSITTRQSSLVNGGEEAKDAEEEEEEVQQVSERAPTLPSCTTSAPRIRVTPQQRQGLHVPAAVEEGRGKRRIQAPNRLTYEALGKPAKSALAGAALMVGEDEESDYEECAFAFFSPVEMPGEPATLKEALESSDAEEWKKAMESELKSIEENGTWELVELLEGRKAITSKWLFKIKSDADGKIERYKSRLVAKGYQQKEKVDYKELFAPVVKPTTLRTLLAGAAIKGWVVKQMDVTTAFLNGVIEEEIFMVQPEGFDDGSGRVLRLKKALYGLKQAPRQWYLKLRGVLEEIGFTPSTADHSLFMLGEGEQRSFMVVYVDDILIFSPSSDLVKEVMLKLQDNHVATPFPSGFKCVKGPEEESVGEEERRRFHSLVGSLMYAAANTRPDVAFATGQLARVVQCPNEEQVAAGMRVAKYLGQTATVGLQFSAAAQRRQKGADGVEPGRLFLTAFTDASYASEPEDMTSVGGFICCVVPPAPQAPGSTAPASAAPAPVPQTPAPPAPLPPTPPVPAAPAPLVRAPPRPGAAEPPVPPAVTPAPLTLASPVPPAPVAPIQRRARRTSHSWSCCGDSRGEAPAGPPDEAAPRGSAPLDSAASDLEPPGSTPSGSAPPSSTPACSAPPGSSPPGSAPPDPAPSDSAPPGFAPPNAAPPDAAPRASLEPTAVIVTIGLNVPKTKDRVHRRISAERLQTLIAFWSQLQMT